jgi:hypothetical protein
MIIKRYTCQTKSNRLHDRFYNEYQVFSAASVRKRPKFGLTSVFIRRWINGTAKTCGTAINKTTSPRRGSIYSM